MVLEKIVGVKIECFISCSECLDLLADFGHQRLSRLPPQLDRGFGFVECAKRLSLDRETTYFGYLCTDLQWKWALEL